MEYPVMEKYPPRSDFWNIKHHYFLPFFLLILFTSLQPAWAQTWQFADVTSASGFNYQHGYTSIFPSVSGERQIIAGGVASGDYDNDGWVDLYVVRGDIGPNLLFKNLGDGTFEERGGLAGVTLTGTRGAGPVFADIDGDGHLDLFVGGIEGTTPSLFRNQGDGTFEDVTTAGGLATGMLGNSYSAAFGDYDRDGDLDLYISHWVFNINLGKSYLFQNDGSGVFTDASETAGLAGLIDADFTPNFADINNDSWPDLLIAGDFGNSHVFLNNQDGTFTDATDPLVITDENGMGAAIGDYDNDGDLDWFVSSIYDPNGVAEANWGITGNRLYRNKGDGTFEDATDEAGVREGFWGWGSCFADFNNDGQLDLYHVNGFILPDVTNLNAQEFHDDPARLFVSNGDATFTERSSEVGLMDTGQGRGIVCFDYDRDGDLDVFIANNQQAPTLYRNDGGNDLHFLNIRLKGAAPNSEAIGARIYLTAGGIIQMRELRAGSNFVSQDPVESHFGLGSSTIVDEVRVVWPNGESSTMQNVVADQHLILLHPSLRETEPILTWTTGEANGVNPDMGKDGDTFEFKVTYTHSGNIPPTMSELWIDRNDDSVYAENVGSEPKPTSRSRQYKEPSLEGVPAVAMLLLGGIPLMRIRSPRKLRHKWTVMGIVILSFLGLATGCIHPAEEPLTLTETDPTEERLTLTETDPTDVDFTDGKDYRISTALHYAGDGSVNYTFRFHDGTSYAMGEPTMDQPLVITKIQGRRNQTGR